MELCRQLGISIPVGKDSMSMKTVWQDDGGKKSVDRAAVADRHRVRAHARCAQHLTPQLRADAGDTELLLIDLGQARTAWAARHWRRCTSRSAMRARMSTMRPRLKAFFDAVQGLNDEGKLLAYHDRSDGGVFVTLCEMAFAGHCGVDVDS